MKMRKVHHVHLARQNLRILQEVRGAIKEIEESTKNSGSPKIKTGTEIAENKAEVRAIAAIEVIIAIEVIRAIKAIAAEEAVTVIPLKTPIKDHIVAEVSIITPKKNRNPHITFIMRNPRNTKNRKNVRKTHISFSVKLCALK